MATLTTTFSQTTTSRPRRFSLSIVTSKPSPLLNLPAELVLDILELVLSKTKPSTLTTISKAISRLVDIVLYRTVVLHSKESITLFHRTTLSRPQAFFDNHVKKLVVSHKPKNAVVLQRVQRAISVCGGVRSLVLSTWFGIDCLASVMEGRTDGGVSEIILQAPDGIDSPLACTLKDDPLSDSVTHLRICEPGEAGWTAPKDILNHFGLLRNLTHLQLSRRINSNLDNDRNFEAQVCDILETRPNLGMLVVVIYPQMWSAEEDDVCASDIWAMMSDVAEKDERLVLVPGKIEDWGMEWRHAETRTGAQFWAEAAK